MSDPDADLGVRAFQDMAQAMDRLGTTLETLETQARTRLDAQKLVQTDLQTLVQKTGLQTAQTEKAAQKALQVAQRDFRTLGAGTAFGAVLVALGGVLGGYWLGEGNGWAQGQQAGYAQARDEKAAMAWSSTPGGQRAFSLDQLGSLDQLTTCSAPGWTVSHQHGHRVCYPKPDKDGNMAGWFVP